MNVGDLVRYKILGPLKHQIGDFPMQEEYWELGLLIEFDKTQRVCIILDNKKGKMCKKHCSDVQLAKVGHATR